MQDTGITIKISRNFLSNASGGYSMAHNRQFPKNSNNAEPRGKNTAIQLFATRAGEQVGQLVASLIVEGITLFLSDNPPAQPKPVEQPPLKLLSAVDVSRVLNISKSMAYHLIQSGEIVSVHMGKTVRVRPQDLDEFINRNKISS